MAKSSGNKKKKYSNEDINEINDFLNKKDEQYFNPGQLDFTLKNKFKNEKQKTLFRSIQDPQTRIIFAKGSAGSGKTYVGLMGALYCLKNMDYNIGKILLSKVIVPAARDIGYLKGELEDKIEPYFQSHWSNISKLVGKKWAQFLKDNEFIEEGLINFMRGDTFGHVDDDDNPVGEIALLDEAQNTTINELKTFISRLGEDSKLIIMGDTDQIDIKLKKDEMNGLDDAFERFKKLEGIEFVEFNEDDIVRDPFLVEVMKRYL